MEKKARTSTIHKIFYSKEKNTFQPWHDTFLKGVEVTWLWMENTVFSFEKIQRYLKDLYLKIYRNIFKKTVLIRQLVELKSKIEPLVRSCQVDRTAGESKKW